MATSKKSNASNAQIATVTQLNAKQRKGTPTIDAAGSADLIPMTFRVFGPHARLIAKAAEKSGVSNAQYVRRVVIEWAASDLGVSVPDTSVYETPHGDPINEAAKKLGVSRKEFMTRVAREAAAKELGLLALKPQAPAPEAPRRRR